MSLLRRFAQKANSPVQSPVRLSKKHRRWRGGSDHVVDGGCVLPVGDVVQANPRSPKVAFEAKLTLQGDVESKEVRKAKLSRRRKNSPKLIHRKKWKTTAPDHRIGQIKLPQLPEQGRGTPRLQKVGRIPGQRPGKLAAEDEIVQREVNRLIRSRARASVGDQHRIAAFPLSAGADLHRLVVVLAVGPKKKASIRLLFVGPAMGSAPADHFHPAINPHRQPAFQGSTPVDEAWQR